MPPPLPRAVRALQFILATSTQEVRKEGDLMFISLGQLELGAEASQQMELLIVAVRGFSIA